MLEKVTVKTTKDELIGYLKENSPKVKDLDENLYSRLVYADSQLRKDAKKVTRSDLAGLVKEVMVLLEDDTSEDTPKDTPKETPKSSNKSKEKTPKDKVLQPVAENSVKKTGAGISKSQQSNTNKSLGDKTPKKDGVTVLNNDSNSDKAVQLAKVFPNTLSVGDTTYTLANNIKNMDDLYNALNNDEEIIFAFYWTKRHLKQFSYFNGWLGQPKTFDNDLDLASTIYVSDEKKVSYQVSMYTDAMYAILPQDLEVTDGIRYSSGIEFQIYRAKE